MPDISHFFHAFLMVFSILVRDTKKTNCIDFHDFQISFFYVYYGLKSKTSQKLMKKMAYVADKMDWSPFFYVYHGLKSKNQLKIHENNDICRR